MINPLDIIAALSRVAALSRACVDDQLVIAIGEELAEWIERGDDFTLDEWLGLRPARGEPSWRQRLARVERDRHLIAAASLITGDLPTKARILADHLTAYHAGAWRDDRHSPAEPSHLVDTVEQHLWRALKAWPGSLGPKMVQSILRSGNSVAT